MKKDSLLTLSLVIIALWWIFQVVWSPGVVHMLAGSDSPAIDRALEYATRGTSQISDIYFSAPEISHLNDVSNLYKPISFGINFLAILAWGWLLLALYQKQDMKISLRLVVKIHMLIIASLGIASLFFPLFFDTFHRILFPQGNWSFPAESMLITLFPEIFWKKMVGIIVGMFGMFGALYWIASCHPRTDVR